MTFGFVTNADGSRGGGVRFSPLFFTAVCLFLPHDISKTDAAMMTFDLLTPK